MSQPSVSFIGLGIMGRPMAEHLLKGGYPLTVHTRTQSRAQSLLSHGAKWANNPAEAAQASDVVFVCVPDTPDVQAVLLGQEGVIQADRPGQIIVDHSTISPSATREMAATLKQSGKILLDAPVSGGDVGAQAGTLSIMVGGEEDAFNHVRPMLELMGKTITWCGDSGNGQLTKLVNQILVTVTNLAVCEALTFSSQTGLDLNKTLQAVGGGAASSWQLLNLGPKMIQRDDRPGFMIDLQQKDLRLVEEVMQQKGLHLRAVTLVRQLFGQAQQQGRGREGTQALYHTVQQVAKGQAQK